MRMNSKFLVGKNNCAKSKELMVEFNKNNITTHGGDLVKINFS